MKILIAEDEQRAREGICRLVESLEGDYQLVGAAVNGPMALDMILSLEPDVVLTDIRMPMIDGIEVAAQAREQGLKTEFVIISGYADFEYARRSIKLNVVDYLLKPVSKEDVENALNRAKERLKGKRSAARAQSGHWREKYPEAHPTVIQALEYIEKNYAKRINQKELAQVLEVSQEYLSSLFTKNIGMTFSEFLKNYRVEQAKVLYESGECPKAEVPERVGYADAKYFNLMFKSVTGKTINEYLSGK